MGRLMGRAVEGRSWAVHVDAWWVRNRGRKLVLACHAGWAGFLVKGRRGPLYSRVEGNDGGSLRWVLRGIERPFFFFRILRAFLGQRHSNVVSGVTSLWELWVQGSVWGR